MAKMPLAKWVEKVETLLQAFGVSVGSCGLQMCLRLWDGFSWCNWCNYGAIHNS